MSKKGKILTIVNAFKLLFCFLILINQKASSSEIDLNLVNSQYSSWGISPNEDAAINVLKVWKDFKVRKKEVVVAVVDTGLEDDHPFLKENFKSAVDFSVKRFLVGKATDEHGHGTHVSGIIKSVFPMVKIISLKYFNQNATGYESLSATLLALQYAVDLNVDIINYSGGGPEASADELRILKQAEKKGILVVCAAGNEGKDIDISKNAFYPASYGLKNIISVSAHDQKLRILKSSNYGKESVDISAPGYRINGPLPLNRSGYLTGTSQATAFVSGVAAIIISGFPNLSVETVKEAILAGTRKDAEFASINKSGGMLDAFNSFNIAKALSKSPIFKVAETKRTGP
jgi:subtilisin family serine protease